MKRAERRRQRRYPVSDVQGTLLFSVPVTVLNMSLTGMAMETTSRLQIGRRYTLKIKQDQEYLTLSGTVTWCSLGKTRKTETGEVVPVYRAGVQFQEVLTERAAEILQFLEKNAVIELEKRLFGRFTLPSPEEVDLDWEYTFSVKTISLSGMRIETDLPATQDSIFELEMRLPRAVLTLKGRVVHVQELPQAKEGPRSELGIEFLDMPRATRKDLERFIQEELT